MVQRGSTFRSRVLQARKTISSALSGVGASAAELLAAELNVLDKTADPRTIARFEFEQAKRLSREFQMDLREVRQLVDIFYEADEDETGGLNKMELETALVRVWNVHVAPAADVEKAWEAMIGKRPMALERLIDEVKLDAFFHWYVETVGNQVLSKQVRRRPSLVTQLTSPLSKMSLSSLSTGLGSSSSLVEPLSPTSLSSTSEPMSPLSPLSPPPAALSEEAVTAMRKRFNRFAEGSCAQGVFFYPQFVDMFCAVYKIQKPESHQKWINAAWREIDVEKSGSINFEAFSEWYQRYFDPISGKLCCEDVPGMITPAA